MQRTDSNHRKSCELASLSTTSSLVNHLQAASPEMWEKFDLAYSPLLRFWIHAEKITPDAEDDVLQESLKSIFGGICQFRKDAQTGTFRGWLRTIVKRRCVDHFRKNNGERNTTQSVLNGIPVPQQKEASLLEAEEDALHSLKARVMELVRRSTSPKSWDMFWLNVVEGVPVSDVARQFHVTPAAVRMAKARILCLLRSMMPNEELHGRALRPSESNT